MDNVLVMDLQPYSQYIQIQYVDPGLHLHSESLCNNLGFLPHMHGTGTASVGHFPLCLTDAGRDDL